MHAIYIVHDLFVYLYLWHYLSTCSIWSYWLHPASVPVHVVPGALWTESNHGVEFVGVGYIACGIRCVVPTAPHAYGTYWIILIHIGQLLNGFVGVPIMTIPTKLSSMWFPPKERTFATAVTNTAQALGVAIGFVTVPYLTRTYDIHTMLYVEAEIALFIALLATIYFPSRPPTPPSVSADEQRSTFVSSLKALMTNKAFILLACSGGIVQGAMGYV